MAESFSLHRAHSMVYLDCAQDFEEPSLAGGPLHFGSILPCSPSGCQIGIAFLLFVLTYWAIPMCAQTGDSCRADIQRLRLPDRAYIDEVMGLDGPPVAFLFIQNGVDVYSATDFKVMQAMQKSNMPFEPTFTVILVYQDEAARQQKIESLLKQPTPIPRDRYPHAPFKNLKYGVWQFKLTPTWVNDVLRREWLISQVQYFEPPSCVPDEERNRSALEENILEASAMMNSRNWIDGVIFMENRRIRPDAHSVLERAVEVMRQKMKAQGLPN